MKKLSREQLIQKIAELEIKNREIVANSELVKNEHKTEIINLNQEWETKIQTVNDLKDLESSQSKIQIESLQQEVEKKQKHLDRKESKKLAQAYEDQEIIYHTSSEKWLHWLMGVGGALILSTAFSIYISSSKVWYDKFEYYLVDIIFLSAVWFCGAQYTEQVKLRNDYANRKTLAQSFHNILNNLPEDEPIKSKFIERATDVLCAPNFINGNEPVLSKKLLKDTVEIVSSLKG